MSDEESYWALDRVFLILAFLVGVMICIMGDLLRKSAMFKAGESFSHIVQSTKKESHKLVVSGVYSMMRHPSYVGWFYWSVGTQVVIIYRLEIDFQMLHITSI